MQNTRLENWQSLLNAHLRTIGPFEWGTNDCCMFAVGCVQVITGVDHGKEYRGYKTALGASRRIEKAGGIDAIATAALGAPKPLKQAQRGDVVLFKNGEDTALGISVGDKIAAVGEKGIIFLPFSEGLQAWSV